MISVLIDTAQPEAWLALVRDGEISAHKQWKATPQVGAELLGALDEALLEVGESRDTIAEVCVHQGPGHFSALRAGIITAATLAYALQCPLKHFATHTMTEAAQVVATLDPVSVPTPVYEVKS